MDEQPSLMWSFVATGRGILVQYPEPNNFVSIASEYLKNLTNDMELCTYNRNGHSFNYLIDKGFITSSLPLDS